MGSATGSSRGRARLFRASILVGVVCALAGAEPHTDVAAALAEPEVSFVRRGEDIESRALAMSGDGGRVVVAGSADVRVLEWDGSEWAAIGGPVPIEVANTGQPVAISTEGSTVAMVWPAVVGTENVRFVRVVGWDGADWSQLGADILVSSHANVGLAISADGGQIAVGEPGVSVTVLQWDGTDWSPVGTAITPDHAEYVHNDTFGEALAMSADGLRVAIGSPEARNGDGYARVYGWDGNSWVQLGGEIVSQPAEDWFGTSLAMSADGLRLAVGAPASEGFDNAVHVFDWTSNDWARVGEPIGEAIHHFFGQSVDLSSDGTRLAVKAAGNELLGISGYLRVLDWDGGAWTAVTDDFDVVAGDAFRGAVALSADGTSVAGESGGTVRVFDELLTVPGTTTTSSPSTTAPPTSVPATLPATGQNTAWFVLAAVVLVLGLVLDRTARRRV